MDGEQLHEESGPVPTPGGSLGTRTPVCVTTLMSRNDSGLDECPKSPGVALGWEGLLLTFHLARALGWDGERCRSSKNEPH